MILTTQMGVAYIGRVRYLEDRRWIIIYIIQVNEMDDDSTGQNSVCYHNYHIWSEIRRRNILREIILR